MGNLKLIIIYLTVSVSIVQAGNLTMGTNRDWFNASNNERLDTAKLWSIGSFMVEDYINETGDLTITNRYAYYLFNCVNETAKLYQPNIYIGKSLSICSSSRDWFDEL